MEKHLSIPLSEEDVRALRPGDIVYLSGELVQLLSGAHKRALEYKAKGTPLPFDVENGGIYHCYTCLTGEGEDLRCAFLGASTSAGVNPWEPDFIRAFRPRAIVGKGGMDQETLQAMQEVGCVYLAQIGGCSQIYSQTVQQVKEKFWEDLAANLGIKFEFQKLGPLVVGMDANGGSLFDAVNATVQENRRAVYETLGIAAP